MKPQDILFILIIIALLWRRDPKYFILAGLICMVFAIPLFQFWVFFTAERLIGYAAGFLFIAIVLLLMKIVLKKTIK
jgi:hypothetical protein